jgi:hypothetical protein
MKYQIDVPAPSDGGDQTYNAAVTGLFARVNLSEDVIHLAREFADTAHGPL